MKKIIKLIMLMLFLLPVTVKADMGVPGIKPYNAYVTKVEGTPYYESNWENNKTVLNKIGTLNYNEEIKVIYEEEIGKVTYAQFRKENKTYYIKVDDIVAKQDSYPIEEATKCQENSNNEYYTCSKTDEYIVLSEDGIEMHTGPARGYENIGETIPKGTKLKFTHYEESTWYYTEYKGIKGWVSELDGRIGKYENKKVINVRELNIYETSTGENRKVLGTIKANTELTAEYSTDDWSSEYLITYNGINGYIDAWGTALYQQAQTIELENDSKMIDILSYNEKELIKKINKGTKITYNYIYSDVPTTYAYTTYNGKTGWVCIEGFEYLVENPSEIETTTTTTTTNKIVIETNKSISGIEIVILCVGAAIIVALTATVTVILVNKNNKKTSSNVETNNNIFNDVYNINQDTNKKE